mmetsp:Transcript_5960/g.10142  ORF Transcript_5960/g.10142 Transcript_5960/m.10142 type:complete len:164 (-) Transcript_5960:92-583(-)
MQTEVDNNIDGDNNNKNNNINTTVAAVASDNDGGGCGLDKKAARREAKHRLREMRAFGDSLPLYHKEGIMAAEIGTVVMFKPVSVTKDGMIYGTLLEYGNFGLESNGRGGGGSSGGGEKGYGGAAGVHTHGGGRLVVGIKHSNTGRTTRECRHFLANVKKNYR